MRSFLTAWNTISPEWVNVCFFTTNLAIVKEPLPAAGLSAPFFEEAAVKLEGGGGPMPPGGAFAMGGDDQPGVGEMPTDGAFGAIAATYILPSLGRAPIAKPSASASPQPTASQIAMRTYPKYAMEVVLVLSARQRKTLATLTHIVSQFVPGMEGGKGGQARQGLRLPAQLPALSRFPPHGCKRKGRSTPSVPYQWTMLG